MGVTESFDFYNEYEAQVQVEKIVVVTIRPAHTSELKLYISPNKNDTIIIVNNKKIHISANNNHANEGKMSQSICGDNKKFHTS